MVEVVEKLKHIVVEKVVHIVVEQVVHTMEVLASRRDFSDFSN